VVRLADELKAEEAHLNHDGPVRIGAN
jgi:hypothetical protein